MHQFSRLSIVFLCIAFASIAVYARSLQNGFVAWDDDVLITGNPMVRELSLKNVAGAFTSYDPELYVPLTTLSFQIEHALVGNRPFVFHLDNLILHVAASCLVFLFLRRLGLAETGALLCAMLFAVHPVNTEAVAWASARKDLLSAVFALASLLSYLRWREGVENGSGRSMVRHGSPQVSAAEDVLQGRRYGSAPAASRWFWWTFLFLLLSLLSKPTAIVLPLVFLLLDWREGRLQMKENARSLWPFLGLSVLFLIIGVAGKAANVSSLTLLQTLLLAAKSTVLSFSLLFYPRFSLLFHQSTPVTLRSPEFLIPLLLTVGAAVVLWWKRTRARKIIFGLSFFLILLVPSFANFSKAGNIYVTSDRYLYLPQIGLFFIAGLLLMRLLRGSTPVRNLTIGVCALVLFGSAGSSVLRSLYWKDSETLFTRALAHNPRSAELHHNLGFALQEKGKLAEAVSAYRKALAMDPKLAKTHFSLGVIAQREGRTDEALAAYRKAAESDPSYPEPHNNIGAILLDRGDLDGAIAEFRRAIDLYPRYVRARLNLADAYGKKGMYAEGLEEYRNVREIDPAFRVEIEQEAGRIGRKSGQIQ